MKIKVFGLYAALFFLFSVFSVIGSKDICFAQTTTSQIQRAQELLEKEAILTKKLEKQDKVYIKKIIVEGVTSLSQDQIKEIISPFEKKWLTRADIQQMMNLILQAYKQKGYAIEPSKISYQIKKRCLKIIVRE